MRNIGGSIGVSLSATLLTRRSSVHQSEMTNYSPLSGQQFQSALQTQMGALGTHFGPAHARYPAELQLYSQLLYQATDWLLSTCSVGWPCFACRERELSGSSSAYRRDAAGRSRSALTREWNGKQWKEAATSSSPTAKSA